MKTRTNCSLFCTFLAVLAGLLTSLVDCSFTFKGGILVGHWFQELRVNDWYECLSECASNGECVSYNLIMAKHDLICELNDCGFENNCEVERNLIKGSGYIFHQLSEVKVR